MLVQPSDSLTYKKNLVHCKKKVIKVCIIDLDTFDLLSGMDHHSNASLSSSLKTLKMMNKSMIKKQNNYRQQQVANECQIE